jgi:hypothetical protein
MFGTTVVDCGVLESVWNHIIFHTNGQLLFKGTLGMIILTVEGGKDQV